MATVYPVTTAQAKAWARIIGDDENDLVDDLIATASVVVAEMAGVAVTYDDAGDAIEVPKNLRQAVLMLVAHWFDNRSVTGAGADREVPFGVQSLVNFSRVDWAVA